MKDGITVCIRAVEGKLPAVELSYKDVCSKCGKYVWVSPATKQSIESGIYSEILVCVKCAAELIEED